MKTDRKIHIIHFQSSPGGIEVLMPALIESMKGYNFRIFVLRPPEKDKINVYSAFNENLITYGATSNLVSFSKLFIYALKNHSDIFHLYNAGPFVLLLVRLAGINKIVYSIRGTKYCKRPWQALIIKLSWYLALNKRVRLIANSIFSKSVFLKEISNRYPIKVLYNPVYRTNFNIYSRDLVHKKLTIIYVGRLALGKNLFRWLDVAKAIYNNFQNVCFKLYGHGPLKNELITYAEKLKINSVVQFMDFTSDINLAYYQADLMIFLSEYESFGNVVVESILCGTPVIASSIPSMKEIFQNYPDFLVDLDDRLQENILKKVDNIDHLKNLVPKATKEFKIRFSIQQHVGELKGIYNSFNIIS